MAKQNGLRQEFYVSGYDVSGDTQSISRIGGGPAVLEFTSIRDQAFDRKGGQFSGQIQASTYFNPGTLDWASPLLDTGSHELFRAMSSADQLVTFFDIQSGCAASLVAKEGNYEGTRAADGAFTFALDAMSTGGIPLEWGRALTSGIVTDTSASQKTSVDFGAGTSFGAQAFLQVFDFSGTDCTVAIQSSSDNGAGDAFANVTGLIFSSVTSGPTSERVATAAGASIERYLRVATTGTFSSISFAVMVVKNEIARAY